MHSMVFFLQTFINCQQSLPILTSHRIAYLAAFLVQSASFMVFDFCTLMTIFLMPATQQSLDIFQNLKFCL
uniref:Uncharacterized protein n=1 Tax=Arundo donax TaxID=35708 RepID=A0A0A9GGQ8_ARUDO